ncbi:MAG: aromatic amino acid lyase [Acidiferrobacter sp.]
MNDSSLKSLLYASYHLTMPPLITAAREKIKTEREWLEKVLSDGHTHSIYGFNTELGHRDFMKVGSRSVAELQQGMFASHNIRPTCDNGFYPPNIARLIGYVKVFQLSHGGSGISPETYDYVITRIADPTFLPQIPAGQSYSSGDVLPAMHWANGVFGMEGPTPYLLKQGEMIAVINGNFVHTALAAGNYEELLDIIDALVVSGAYAGRICNLPAINFVRALTPEKGVASRAIEYLVSTADSRKNLSTSPQLAVSIRAIADVIVEFMSCHQRLGVELNGVLGARSANPLFDAQRQEVFSSPSFLAIGLAFAQSQMVEALLLTLRASVARLSFILSGRLSDIPMDGVDKMDGQSLGFIQIPKELTAQVEFAYQRYGRRTYASGGATSQGIEDLWTHGETLSRDIHELSVILRHVLVREMAVYEVISQRYAPLRAMHLCPDAVPRSADMMQSLDTVERYLRGQKRFFNGQFVD